MNHVRILTRFVRSLAFAGRGLAAVFRAEANFRIQCVALAAALVAGTYVRIRAWEFVMLVLAGGSVLVLECINSAVERLLDLVQPRLHGYVREIKDVMAAAVLIAACGATMIAVAILVPPFVRMWE
jgi:diacylglycerol kinase